MNTLTTRTDGQIQRTAYERTPRHEIVQAEFSVVDTHRQRLQILGMTFAIILLFFAAVLLAFVVMTGS